MLNTLIFCWAWLLEKIGIKYYFDVVQYLVTELVFTKNHIHGSNCWLNFSGYQNESLK